MANHTLDKLKAHGALLGANFIYGANYSIAKEVMPAYIQPFGFILTRVSGALLLYWLFSVTNKIKIERSDAGRIIALGFFGVAFNQLLFFKGLNITSPINASIIMISNPLIVLLFAVIFLGDRITWHKALGISSGFFGAFLLLLFRPDFKLGSDTWPGDLMILLNSSSWAVYLILAKPLLKKYPTIVLVKWVFLAGFIMVLPFGWEEFTAIKWQTFSTSIWVYVCFVVVFTTFIAYLLNTYALNHLSAPTVSVYIYLQPLLAGLIAIYWGKDTLSGVKILATFFIALGVYLVSKPTLKN